MGLAAAPRSPAASRQRVTARIGAALPINPR